jgi:hypothetical protein
MKKKSKDYKPGHPLPASMGVTGVPPSAPGDDDVERLSSELEQIGGEGTQSGSHPAKTQSKVMRFF